MSDYLGNFLSKFKCGFRQRISAQLCLEAMLEKWKACVDKGKNFGAVLSDLSKAFDCLPNNLVFAELNACGFSIKVNTQLSLL